MEKVTFTLNHKRVTLETDPETPLLWVLRDELGLTGTKYSCGMGICGSCTVLIDGNARRSCRLPVKSVIDKEVVTIEGLGVDGLHAVQNAWVEEEVPQCGYCQSGQILNAVALLEKNPDPSDAEIDRAMDGVLCRCGTYQRIKKAIHKAAEEVRS
ncbi:MAG: (2Fe-2S)-binding protein [Candidatus Marinimicrobia bacterium]|nr:(2Fe-2S)-binding protein [Candidatus Neomarinimicrobiota bacterium]